jgi:hypothetical protein
LGVVLKELISETQAEWIIAGLCLGLLVIGPIVAWKVTKTVRKAVFFAGVGPVLYILWRLYNAIENHYGLDSVKGLGISAVLIVGTLGVLLPLLYIRFIDPSSPRQPSGPRPR